MKLNQSRAVLIGAIIVIGSGFFIDQKRCVANKPSRTCGNQAPLVAMNQPLTVDNRTGAKVSAAFYNKRLKRSGSVMSLKDDRTDLKRRPQASLIAVSRNARDLGIALKKSAYPRRINIRHIHNVAITSNGNDLVITPTSSSRKR